MTANPALVKERNISDQNAEYINQLHEMLEELIETYTLDIDFYKACELCRDMEFLLQDLWGFSRSQWHHTWVNKLKDKWMLLTWEYRTFRCRDTGKQLTICGDMVYEGAYISFGNCFVDLGRAGSYSRFGGNIEEV